MYLNVFISCNLASISDFYLSPAMWKQGQTMCIEFLVVTTTGEPSQGWPKGGRGRLIGWPFNRGYIHSIKPTIVSRGL